MLGDDLVSHHIEQFLLRLDDRVYAATEAVGHSICLASRKPPLVAGGVNHCLGMSSGVVESLLLHCNGTLHELFCSIGCHLAGLAYDVSTALEQIDHDPILVDDAVHRGFLHVGKTIHSAIGEFKQRNARGTWKPRRSLLNQFSHLFVLFRSKINELLFHFGHALHSTEVECGHIIPKLDWFAHIVSDWLTAGSACLGHRILPLAA